MNDSEQTEGGMLKQLSISEPFPFRHGYAATLSPFHGDSFWLAVTAKRLPHMENWQTEGLTEGVNSQYPLKFCQK